jgi:hypothetical protein
MHAPHAPATRPIDRRRLPRRSALVAFGVLTAAVLTTIVLGRAVSVPAGLDLASTRLSSDGLYRVTYESEITPVPVNALHSWILAIDTPAGEPVIGAAVAFDGDMPQHGHGLPTLPRVSGEIAPGRYLVEGVKFQMGGWWVIDVTVTAAGGHSDTVSFDLLLSR